MTDMTPQPEQPTQATPTPAPAAQPIASSPIQPVAQATTLSAFSDQLADVVESAARSLVTVAARPRQTATGIIWQAGAETVIVTADHVIEREEDIKIILADKREIKAQLVGRDSSTDLAVLRLPTGSLSGLTPLATNDNPRVGALSVAIGKPTAEGPRVSFGAISAIEGPRRSWQGGEIEKIIFADVTLYPGFSGGPLIDLAGRVVGMNTSQLTRQNSSAVPVITINRVVNTLLTHGRVRRGYLGIGTQQAPLPAALAQKAGVSQSTALLVVTVEPGSPAEQGGLLLGDLILALDNQPINDVEGLRAFLSSDTLGKSINIKTLRGGEPRDLTVTIGERK